MFEANAGISKFGVDVLFHMIDTPACLMYVYSTAKKKERKLVNNEEENYFWWIFKDMHKLTWIKIFQILCRSLSDGVHRDNNVDYGVAKYHFSAMESTKHTQEKTSVHVS